MAADNAPANSCILSVTDNLRMLRERIGPRLLARTRARCSFSGFARRIVVHQEKSGCLFHANLRQWVLRGNVLDVGSNLTDINQWQYNKFVAIF